MDTEAVSRWLSIGANFGVLVGIVFLAVEIQQNTEMTRAQITQSRAEAALAMADLTANSDYLPAIMVKARNGEPLTDEEAIRYVVQIRAALRNQDNNIQQYRQGLLEEYIPRSVAGAVRNIIGTSFARAYWTENKTGYSEAFVEFVDAILAEEE